MMEITNSYGAQAMEKCDGTQTTWAVQQFLQRGKRPLSSVGLRRLLSRHSDQARLLGSSDEIRIPPEASAALRRELAKIRVSPYEKEAQFEFAELARSAVMRTLPSECLQAIRNLREPGHRGIISVHGMPQDAELGPTPTDGLQPAATKGTFVGEGVQLGVSALLGTVYTLEFEKAH